MLAVERVLALRKARRQFDRLSDATWAQLIYDIAPRLLAQQMTDARAIELAIHGRITAVEEIRSSPKVETSVSGLTESSIKRAAADVRTKGDRSPSRTDVAAELHTSEATLYRAMKKLGMGHWPPGPPGPPDD
jgi:hypothetical protein